eukprot:TRINITY_DN2621_c0_g2_i1.p1 TRINITY_DN2621_c0_g2~~TRINITY_DN2621_c0_g2_i1.p1  ORF type:complete len:628 (+),score=65.72 TRINITY_DN2621_c0_g2_i1:42-1925(+)
MNFLKDIFRPKKRDTSQDISLTDVGYDVHSKRVVWVETGDVISPAISSCLQGLCYFRTVRCDNSLDAITEITRGNVITVVLCLRKGQPPTLYDNLVHQIHRFSLAIPIISVGEDSSLGKDFLKRNIFRYATANNKVGFVQVGSTFMNVCLPTRDPPLRSNFLNRVSYDRHYGTMEVGKGTPFEGATFVRGRMKGPATGFDEVLVHAKEEVQKLCPDTSCYIVTEPPHGDDSHREVLQKRFPRLYPTYTCCEEALSLYATGNTSGIVISIGWGHIRVVPILDGNPIINRVRVMTPSNGKFINSRIKMGRSTYLQGTDAYMKNARVISYEKSRSILKDLTEEKVVLDHPDYTSGTRYSNELIRAKFITNVIEKKFAEPVAETWVEMEEYFNTKLYTLLSGRDRSEVTSESLTQMVRNCIDTISNEDRPKVCSTVQLCGSIGWCKGFKERLSRELFECDPSPDCMKWSDEIYPFDDDANCSLDAAVASGKDSLFVTTTSRGLLCKLSEPMTATDIKTGNSTPLFKTGLEDLHPFQPHPKFTDMPMEVIERIFDFLGPLSVYCINQSITTAMEVGTHYDDQAELGVRKLLQDYECCSVIPQAISSERGIRELILASLRKVKTTLFVKQKQL